MSKFSSKLNKNENNSVISLYPIDLPKLHENILKYQRLNFFKENAIGFNVGLQTTLESLTSLSENFLILIKLINAAAILAFGFIFGVGRSLFGLSFKQKLM